MPTISWGTLKKQKALRWNGNCQKIESSKDVTVKLGGENQTINLPAEKIVIEVWLCIIADLENN